MKAVQINIIDRASLVGNLVIKDEKRSFDLTELSLVWLPSQWETKPGQKI